jgi:hypothetical protein
MSDLFADPGTRLLEHLDLPAPYLARIGSLRRLIDDLDVEIPGSDPPWCGVRRRDRRRAPVSGPAQLASFGRADPQAPRVRHSPAPRPDHHARPRLVRWAAIESVQALGPGTGDRRGRNVGKTAAARQQLGYVYWALRDGHGKRLGKDPVVIQFASDTATIEVAAQTEDRAAVIGTMATRS